MAIRTRFEKLEAEAEPRNPNTRGFEVLQFSQYSIFQLPLLCSRRGGRLRSGLKARADVTAARVPPKQQTPDRKAWHGASRAPARSSPSRRGRSPCGLARRSSLSAPQLRKRRPPQLK